MTIFNGDEYSDLREILGLCLAIFIVINMILQFSAGILIYFKFCRRKHRKSKKS